ncbi:MAG: AAA family ATPase [Bacteroidales bacterium]|nr:AAA family ATPase [Bacteroidales bacterium]
MFLKTLNIKNFRAIKELIVDFNDGVNILIGENNSGKTAVIDALRICYGYGSQWRAEYVKQSDFHIDKHNHTDQLPDVEFHLYFELQQEVEAGWFNDLLSVNKDNKQELQLHFRYYVDEKRGTERIRYQVWGGDNEGQMITPDVLDLFYFVHLEALRDAVQYLRPIRGNRLGQLYSNLVPDKDRRQELASKVRKSLHDDDEWKDLIEDGKTKVNEHLKKTSIKGKQQNVTIDFLDFEFGRLVEYLKMQMPVYEEAILNGDGSKQKFFQLFQNGLGYNNLIYTATVLGDLKRKRELEPETYIALLIEEPEAHLHPQLQNIFFNYLSILNNLDFQIFITSHSPSITAKATLDSLIVLQNQNAKIHSLSLKNSKLTDNNKKYLHKFLDVTKSQLFFANGVVMVEGISEALLLPELAKIVGEDYNLEKNGVELVNINGVAFSHFAHLFNPDEETKRLECRCAILTDDDREDNDQEAPRATKAKELENGLLIVELAEQTFEYELFMAGDNKDIMLEIFKKIRPRASGNIEQGENQQEYAKNFVAKIATNKAKSELAHQLSVKLQDEQETREVFTVPDYIERAIKWVVKGEKDV